MSRIPLPRPEAATGPLKDAFDAVRARFGAVPNGVRTLGVSPEALSGFLSIPDTTGLMPFRVRRAVPGPSGLRLGVPSPKGNLRPVIRPES